MKLVLEALICDALIDALAHSIHISSSLRSIV